MKDQYQNTTLELMVPDILYDVVIIGCGINGILALEYFGKKGLNVLLLDKDNISLSFMENYMI